ncbi:S-layer homology domain-containing protein [Planococcus glaciei]|uniref:S-layer homology domain-containing protein n=1 Tax=Planococcus glaciei TaxID=459472 RepID=UPI001C735D3D|nr:S-layer homology domain-containing protein [Planococcus glaciei]MBX0316840.1 S-layer homology domain-containing protein [Planococcus glaciei]
MFMNAKKKFMASAAAAALAVTAIAPVAGAEEVKGNAEFLFSDVPANYTHFNAIYTAVDYKMLSGYQDGTYKPYQALSRANVVKALGKYVVTQSGKKVSDFNLVNVKPFSDVPATHPDKELYTYSLIVKQAGIFTGSNNKLMPTNLIQRQQIAKVLVEAFDLADLEGVSSKVKDNAKAYDDFYRNYINILSENGVTTESLYRPLETTTRGQLASFLVRSYDVAHPGEETPVEAIDEFEEAISGFVGLTEEFGVEVKPHLSKENTYIITVPEELPEEEVQGTGFFTTLADEGIKTIVINGKTFTVSDGNGNVAPEAKNAGVAILTAAANEETLSIVVNIPYGDGNATTAVTYTFNIVS